MKVAELDDDAVAKAIIAIVDLLPKLGSGKEVEQGRIGSALSKKERVVSLSLLTLFVVMMAVVIGGGGGGGGRGGRRGNSKRDDAEIEVLFEVP